LWTPNEADSERREALKETGVDLVVTSLCQAVERWWPRQEKPQALPIDRATTPPSRIGAASAAD
jgi:hypothetical protein